MLEVLIVKRDGKYIVTVNGTPTGRKFNTAEAANKFACKFYTTA